MAKVGILEGSLRKGSFSCAVGRNAARLAPEGLEFAHLPSTGAIPLYDQDVLDKRMPDEVEALAGAIRAVDALLVVTPEYNWSFPGVLKNAIDWLSMVDPNPLEGMPAAIWSVAPGKLGGARLHEGLRHVLQSQGMELMARPEVQVAGIKGKIDLDADLVTDPDTEDFLRKHLAAFAAFCAERAARGS